MIEVVEMNREADRIWAKVEEEEDVVVVSHPLTGHNPEAEIGVDTREIMEDTREEMEVTSEIAEAAREIAEVASGEEGEGNNINII